MSLFWVSKWVEFNTLPSTMWVISEMQCASSWLLVWSVISFRLTKCFEVGRGCHWLAGVLLWSCYTLCGLGSKQCEFFITKTTRLKFVEKFCCYCRRWLPQVASLRVCLRPYHVMLPRFIGFRLRLVEFRVVFVQWRCCRHVWIC